MVDPALRLEIAGETASDAGRCARCTQQGAVQQREVIAEAEHSPLDGPLAIQGRRIDADHVVKDRFRADGLHMRHALDGEPQALNLRRVVMN